jgi:hypothetical protein
MLTSRTGLHLSNYMAHLFGSELPFSPGLTVLVWLGSFLSNHLVARIAHAANDAQRLIVVEGQSDALRRGLRVKYILAQLLFAGVVYGVALSIGGQAFVFFVGGLIVSAVCTLGLNVQAAWSARAWVRPGAAHGAVTLSTSLGFRQLASRLGGYAVTCLILGLALAHLALLGGALILGSTALGYLRRAKSPKVASAKGAFAASG